MSVLHRHWHRIFFLIVVFFSVYAAAKNLTISSRINADTSLVLLANQFIHRHISLEPTVSMPLGDISKFGGKYYVYFGPFPSVLLMPVVLLLGSRTPQILIGLAALLLSGYAAYSISRSLKFSTRDAGWLMMFYLFSSVLLSSSIINITAYQVEALGSSLVLLSLREYMAKRRPWLTGTFLGLAVLTRAALLPALLFYALEYFARRLSLRQLAQILIPIAVSLALFAGYNYIRFGSFVETGYAYNITLHSYPLSENLKYGYMSPVHIPANLYSLFVMPPQPLTMDTRGFVLKFPFLKVNPWGLAIWYTSPLCVLLLYKWKKGLYSVSAAVTAIAVSLPLLMYYSIGFAQFGYRYALDFFPFIFILLIHTLQPALSFREIILILIGMAFNALYMMSSWNLYPLLGIPK